MVGSNSVLLEPGKECPSLDISTLHSKAESVSLPPAKKKNKKKKKNKNKNKSNQTSIAAITTVSPDSNNFSTSSITKLPNIDKSLTLQADEVTQKSSKKKNKGKKSKPIQEIQKPIVPNLISSIIEDTNSSKVLNDSELSALTAKKSSSDLPKANSVEPISDSNSQKRKRETESNEGSNKKLHILNITGNTETTIKTNLTPPKQIIVISDSSDEEIENTIESETANSESDFILSLHEKHAVCRSLNNMPKNLTKYWNKRYKLFSRYDEGCLLDIEGWYSVTPELVAKRIAERLACKTIVDGFCGVGGNTIQFALTCDHVIAIDNNPTRLAFAKQNAKIYGVDKKIEFILGDFFEIAPTLKVDGVFLSPPWGGPAYSKVPKFDIKTMLPFSGVDLFDVCAKIADRIAYFLPRNTDYEQLGELAVKFGPCEIEEQFFDTHFIAITAFYEKHFTNV